MADTALGKMLDKGKDSGRTRVEYLRNVNVQWGRIDTDDLLTMELADDERERFEVRAGDLLVCEGGEIGRAAIWNGRSEYIAFQKALHRIRPSEVLEGRFLRYLLEHHSQSGVLACLASGSTIAHLPQQQLRKVPVPLPPLPEQHRIVDLLEDHLSRLDAAEGYLRAAERRLDGAIVNTCGSGCFRQPPFRCADRHLTVVSAG
ncbi:restriction endonuclease subunit S [Mycobacterium sp. NAZ190054]|uniref:restriction endonuclease subunit S n=1 Tax=Mycobacterium sp. NAZ190054 TaxID=1747766 RepID=UPI0018D20F13|nr:restriction endonuclease subunit S [Mycobacterium sp. NAZ190054]